jgi:hypothetical protein
VIATVAFSEGALNETGFSIVILATLIISLVIPFLAGKKESGKRIIFEENDTCQI